jgi:hypothetical protein
MTPHDHDHDYTAPPSGLHVEEVIGILRETLEYLGHVRADEPDAAWSLRKRVQDALDALRPPTPAPTPLLTTATLHDDAEGHAR